MEKILFIKRKKSNNIFNVFQSFSWDIRLCLLLPLFYLLYVNVKKSVVTYFEYIRSGITVKSRNWYYSIFSSNLWISKCNAEEIAIKRKNMFIPYHPHITDWGKIFSYHTFTILEMLLTFQVSTLYGSSGLIWVMLMCARVSVIFVFPINITLIYRYTFSYKFT